MALRLHRVGAPTEGPVRSRPGAVSDRPRTGVPRFGRSCVRRPLHVQVCLAQNPATVTPKVTFPAWPWCTASQTAHSSPFGAGLSAPRCHAPPTPPSGRGRPPAGSTLKRAASTRRSAEPLRPRFFAQSSPRNRRRSGRDFSKIYCVSQGWENTTFHQNLLLWIKICAKRFAREKNPGKSQAPPAHTQTPDFHAGFPFWGSFFHIYF